VDGSDQRLAGFGGLRLGDVFELGAKAVNVDVEGVLLDLGDVAPAGFDELLARSDQACAAHERFEKLELLAGERDVAAVADGDAAATVERDASGADEDGGLGCAGATGDGTDPGEQNL
jgi:hypothetical protein